MYAMVGVIKLFLRHVREGGTAAIMVSLFLVGAIMGLIDFLLPAFAFLELPVWQPDFLGRLLDSIFYLPTAVACLGWLDSLDEYGGIFRQVKEPCRSSTIGDEVVEP